MKKSRHLSNDFLVRFLDDEMPAGEASAVEQHLNSCAECRHRYHDLAGVSESVENFVSNIVPRVAGTERAALALLLNTEAESPVRQPQKPFRQFAWGMALAASLALGLILAPRLWHPGMKSSQAGQDASQATATLEVDGETFVPLPYSNPDLPATPHIVQMQVPVSSLVDAGVHFEAISNEVSTGDESVFADVLLGIDGQPLGVHVLSVE